MSEGLPPPPSYDSLYAGGQRPIIPGHQHSENRAARPPGFSRQASAESPFPPSHPFYPGPPSGFGPDPLNPEKNESPSSKRHQRAGTDSLHEVDTDIGGPSGSSSSWDAGPPGATAGHQHGGPDALSSPPYPYSPPSPPGVPGFTAAHGADAYDRPGGPEVPLHPSAPPCDLALSVGPEAYPSAPGPHGRLEKDPAGDFHSESHPSEHQSRERLQSISPRVSPRPSISGAMPVSKIPSPADQAVDPLMNPGPQWHDGPNTEPDMQDPYQNNTPYPLHPNRRPYGPLPTAATHPGYEPHPSVLDPHVQTQRSPFGEFQMPTSQVWQERAGVPGGVDDQPAVEFRDDADVVNPNAPPACRFLDPEELDEIVLGEGQREIDQIGPPRSNPAFCKWCCVAFWSLNAHIGFCICVLLLVWQVPLKLRYEREWAAWRDAYRNMSRGPEPVKEYDRTTVICASVFLVVCWITGVIEGCMSDTDSYVGNTMPINEFREYVRSTRKKVPTIRWIGESYHHAKERIQWVGGRMVSRRPSKDSHRCVTHREVIAFPFTVCVDASGDTGTFKKGVIHRFEFEKTFGFADAATAQEYSYKKNIFLDRIKSKDEAFDFQEEFDLPDMKERVTVFIEEGCRSTLMKPGFYLCLTCLLLTWPYRVFFRCSTRKKKFTFVKLIQL